MREALTRVGSVVLGVMLGACSGQNSDNGDVAVPTLEPVDSPSVGTEPVGDGLAEGDNGAGAALSYNYSGPGSFYDASINADGTFRVDVSDILGAPVKYTMAGSYVRLSTGFLKMTVNTVNGTGGPELGSEAHALEVPGFALILKPIGGDEIIPMLVRGTCPSANFRANWVIAQSGEQRDASEANRDWFGVFAYTQADQSGTLPSKYDLVQLGLVSDEHSNDFDASSCDQGLLQIREDNQVVANMWLTDGGAIVETMEDGRRGQTIFGMRQQPVELAELAGDYAALVLPGSSEAGEVFPAALSMGIEGRGVGHELVDVTLGTLSEAQVQFTVGNPNVPDTGWVTGKIESDDSSGNLACSTLTKSSGSKKNVVFCIGQDPGDVSRPFTMVMVSQ